MQLAISIILGSCRAAMCDACSAALLLVATLACCLETLLITEPGSRRAAKLSQQLVVPGPASDAWLVPLLLAAEREQHCAAATPATPS